MIEEHAPRVEADTEAIDPWLLEGVLAEQTEKLEHWKIWVVLDSLEVRRDKPVEEITAFGQKSAYKDIQNRYMMKRYMYLYAELYYCIAGTCNFGQALNLV